MKQPQYQVIQGNSAQQLKQFPDNHFDAVVTDPPYGINFLGKDWDKDTGEEEVYRECLRVLKPGGHLLAFSAARTYHHLAMAVERAGFEIRDQIMWVYASGFPKSQDIGRHIQKSLGVKETKTVDKLNGYVKETKNDGSIGVGDVTADDYTKQMTMVVPTDPEAKQWAGWGTNLKPAHEPIVMARKPIKTSIAANAQKWGTGAINIDACRVGDEEITVHGGGMHDNYREGKHGYGMEPVNITHTGRFPSNVIGEITGYEKFFYQAKVSRAERNIGCEDIKPVVTFQGTIGVNKGPVVTEKFQTTPTNNHHPTVKPVALMKYLIQLVTPPNGHVLDPFNGSGSTGMAAVELGYQYTGIELDPKYVEIANKRIRAWWEKHNPPAFSNPLFTEE